MLEITYGGCGTPGDGDPAAAGTRAGLGRGAEPAAVGLGDDRTPRSGVPRTRGPGPPLPRRRGDDDLAQLRDPVRGPRVRPPAGEAGHRAARGRADHAG